MNIYWMDTKEGPQIPLLMVRAPNSIDNVNTSGMSPGSDAGWGTGDTASPEWTQSIFDATNDELYRFMSDLALGEVIYNNGRTLTFANQGEYGEDVKIGISPIGLKHHSEDLNVDWYDNGGSTIPPFDSSTASVSAWKVSAPAPSYPLLAVDISSTAYDQYMTKTAIEATDEVSIFCLIRDNTGRVKVVNLVIFQGGYSFAGKVCVTTSFSYGMVYQNFPDSFWQAQTGGEPTPPKAGGIVDVTDRFSPRVQTAGLGAYILTKEDISGFIFDMWTTSFGEKFLYNILGNPIESIIGLRWYYGLLGSIKRSPTDCYLTVGNVAYNGNWLEGGSAIINKPAASEMLTYTCGEIEIDRYFNNFLDLSPFTKLQIYIPYVGFVALDITEYMGRRIRLDYNVNIYTGAAIAYIYRSIGDNDFQITMEIPCSMGIEVPLTVNAKDSILSRVATAAAGVAGAGLGAATRLTVPGIAAGVATQTAEGLGNDQAGKTVGAATAGAFQHISNSIYAPSIPSGDIKRSGGMTSETSSLGNLQPFLMFNRPISVAPEDYSDLVGSPDFSSGVVGDFDGYFRIAGIKSPSQTTTKGIPRSAMHEIEQLLRAGVYSA